jgi:hypothetical protein
LFRILDGDPLLHSKSHGALVRIQRVTAPSRRADLDIQFIVANWTKLVMDATIQVISQTQELRALPGAEVANRILHQPSTTLLLVSNKQATLNVGRERCDSADQHQKLIDPGCRSFHFNLLHHFRAVIPIAGIHRMHTRRSPNREGHGYWNNSTLLNYREMPLRESCGSVLDGPRSGITRYAYFENSAPVAFGHMEDSHANPLCQRNAGTRRLNTLSRGPCRG